MTAHDWLMVWLLVPLVGALLWLVRLEVRALRQERDELLFRQGRVEVLPIVWDERSKDWYNKQWHEHPQGSQYVRGFQEGWEHASELLQAELNRGRK